MPVYNYSTEQDAEHGLVSEQRVFSMGQAPWTITLPDGRKAHRNIASEHRKMAHPSPWTRPLRSTSASVPPHQVGELRAFLAKHGEDSSIVQPNGIVEFRSRAQRKRVNRLRGMIDRNAGYGD